MPHFQEVYESHQGQFELIALAAPNSMDAAKFVKENAFTFTMAQSPEAFEKYKAEGLPVTVFIDRNGNMVERVDGALTKAAFEAKLAKIL